MSPSPPVWLRRRVLILYWITMLALTHWPDIGRYAPDRVRLIPHLDKLVHVGLYLGWMVLWGWVLTAGGRRLGGRTIGLIAAGGLLWAVFDELTQALVRRQPDVLDLACDIAGLAAGAGVLLLWQRAAGKAPVCRNGGA